MYTITINAVDVTSQLQLGQSQFTTDASVILDNGKITIINQTIDQIERGLQVIITITKNSKTLTFYAITTNDKITELSRHKTYYKHEIGIIEETKWLEKFYGSLYIENNINISLALGRVYDQLLGKSINIDATVKTYLDSITVNEHFFNDLSAREMMDFILQQVNGQVRLKNGIIYVDFYSAKNNEKNSSDRETYDKETTFNDYATRARILLKNALNKQLPRYVPSKNGFTGLRSLTLKIDTNSNAVFDCGKDIDSLDKFYFNAFNTSTGYAEWDMTYAVVEYDEWLTLPKGTGTSTSGTKNTTLYYKRGDRYIYNFYSGIFDSAIPTIFVNHPNYTGGTWTSPTTYDICLCRAVFYAYDDVTIEPERMDTEYIKRDSETVINQQAEILDIEKATKNGFNELQRIGHEEFITSKVITDFNDLYDLYDYDGDYIISAITYKFNFNHLIVNYIWTKNFIRLQKQIKIDSKKRYYAIPKEFVRRILNYKDYIEISKTNKTDTAEYITIDGRKMLFKQYGGISGTNPINYYTFDNSIMATNDRIVGSVNPYGTSGGIYIKMGFETNQEQGIKKHDQDDTSLMQSVKFTANDGTLNNFNLDFVETYIPSTRTNYPLATTSEITGKTYISIYSGIIEKTAGEAQDVVYQLIPYSDDDTAYLYEEFFKNNPLIKDGASSLTFKVWDSTEEYNELDLALKGTVSTATVTFNILTDAFKVTINGGIVIGRKAYAITDQNNNLLMAFNTLEASPIRYFNFLKQRTDIIKL